MIYGPDKVLLLLLQLLPTTYLSNASSFTLFSSTNNFPFVIAHCRQAQTEADSYSLAQSQLVTASILEVGLAG